MVRLRGLEPPRRFQRYHLKVVRLPIPPQPQTGFPGWAAWAQVQIHEDAEVTERSHEGKRQIGSSGDRARATSCPDEQ